MVGALIGALVNQIISSVDDHSLELARDCNAGLFCNDHDGLLLGPHHPDYGKAK